MLNQFPLSKQLNLKGEKVLNLLPCLVLWDLNESGAFVQYKAIMPYNFVNLLLQHFVAMLNYIV